MTTGPSRVWEELEEQDNTLTCFVCGGFENLVQLDPIVYKQSDDDIPTHGAEWGVLIPFLHHGECRWAMLIVQHKALVTRIECLDFSKDSDSEDGWGDRPAVEAALRRSGRLKDVVDRLARLGSTP